MFTIIMINIWIGVPYQMLIATGVLMNIPADMIEAARIDGANPVQMFFRIKLPTCSACRSLSGNGFRQERQQLQRHLPAHAGCVCNPESGPCTVQRKGN